MECDRATMFPFFAPPSQSSDPSGSPETPQPEKAAKTADRLRDHVVKQSEKLGERFGCFFICRAFELVAVPAANGRASFFFAVDGREELTIDRCRILSWGLTLSTQCVGSSGARVLRDALCYSFSGNHLDVRVVCFAAVVRTASGQPSLEGRR